MKCQIYNRQDLLSEKLPLLPGDFILTHGGGLFDQLIQIFTRSPWNHVALIIDREGSIVELVEQGIRRHHLGKYDACEIFLVRTDFGEQDRSEIVSYAIEMLRRHEKYGFFQIASIALKIITKSRLIIKLDGTLICSEFVANALARGGVIWDSDTSLITPADLYRKLVQGKKEAELR
jgi:hypothetical protein